MPATISSTFNTDADGWTLNGDVSSSGWSSSGGDPGGYLYWVDAATGADSYYNAPTKFLGNKAAYYGGSLSYDILDTGNGDVTYDVQVVGGGHTLQYTSPNDAGFPTPNQWSHASVQLVAGNFIDTATGKAPTPTVMRSVLSSLTDLEIRAEYVNGNESGGLDNVSLSGAGTGSSFVVSSGVTSTGLVLSSGWTETVLAGGTSSKTIVLNGGHEYVSAGGVDAAAIISSGGVLTVSSAGVARAEQIRKGGTEVLSAGAVASGGTVSSGGLVSGGGTEVRSLTVLSGGQVSGIGFGSGGTDVMNAGAVETGVTISSGAALRLIDPTVGAGETLSVGRVAGATAFGGAAVQSGGKIAAVDAMAESGGVISVLKGGVVSGLTVSDGGVADLASGSVLSGGTTVLSGATISGPGTVSGFIDVESGATVSNVRFAYSTTVDLDGTAVYGGANAQTLEGFVHGAGDIVEQGPGRLVISSFNYSFDGELVISGGTAELANFTGLGQGSAAFENAAGSATLKIDTVDQPASGTPFSTALVDFDSSTRHLDLADLTFSAGATAVVTSSGGGSATLTLTDGSYSAEFTLVGAIASQYVVASDNAGGTLVRAKTGAAIIEAVASFEGEAAAPGALHGSNLQSARVQLAEPTGISDRHAPPR